MSDTPTQRVIKEKIVAIIANKLWAGKSLEQISKMSKKELSEWDSTIDELVALLSSTLEPPRG